jgi:lipopolysaccharide transport system permease protein
VEVNAPPGPGARAEPRPIYTIAPARRWQMPDFGEIWRTRELLAQLVAADYRARHRQTAIGIAWAILQPFAAMVVFSLIFGVLGKFPSEGLPYPVFFFAGYVVWQFFQRGLSNSVINLATNTTLITKIYFPRTHLLLAPIGTAAVDSAMAALVLAALYLFYGVAPHWPIVFLPLFLVLALAAIVAFSLWLAPLNVKYRDVQAAMPSLMQLWFFLTPVVFPVSVIPESLRLLAYLNPMASVLEGCRWGLVGAPPPSLAGLAISAAVIAALLVPGLLFFGAQSRTLADRI